MEFSVHAALPTKLEFQAACEGVPGAGVLPPQTGSASQDDPLTVACCRRCRAVRTLRAGAMVSSPLPIQSLERQVQRFVRAREFSDELALQYAVKG